MIEILTFRLAVGADDAAFVRIDKRVQAEFAYQQPGLVRRTTARSEDGGWIVIDLWQSDEAADTCEARWGQDPVTAEFMSLIDPPSVATQRYTTLE